MQFYTDVVFISFFYSLLVYCFFVFGRLLVFRCVLFVVCFFVVFLFVISSWGFGFYSDFLVFSYFQLGFRFLLYKRFFYYYFFQLQMFDNLLIFRFLRLRCFRAFVFYRRRGFGRQDVASVGCKCFCRLLNGGLQLSAGRFEGGEWGRAVSGYNMFWGRSFFRRLGGGEYGQSQFLLYCQIIFGLYSQFLKW